MSERADNGGRAPGSVGEDPTAPVRDEPPGAGATPGPDDGEAETADPSAPTGAEGEDGLGEAAAEPTAEDELLALAEAQRDEYLALAQRAQADFDNYRKRATKEIAAAGSRAKVQLVREVLPVVDNLERALASSGEADGSLVEGVRLVHSELAGALERAGVEPIEPAGERFDPNVHEALSTRAADGAEAGVVLDVVQKGYRLEATVLRPARVVVAA